MDLILFLVFAIVAVVAAINMVVQTHPISSALSLVGVMASLAVLYLLLGAEFMAVAQIIVYAGAVMVLFVFVIMLLNTEAERDTRGPQFAKILGIPMLFALALLLGVFVYRMIGPTEGVTIGGFTGGTAKEVGRQLFQNYVLPFEVTSILILIAIVGAVVLARKDLDHK